jgi:hypothetical protein
MPENIQVRDSYIWFHRSQNLQKSEVRRSHKMPIRYILQRYHFDSISSGKEWSVSLIAMWTRMGVM